MYFINPPSPLLAYGTTEGVELGGSKCVLSLDHAGNIIFEQEIFTEMSWGTFYKDEGIEDQIESFTTQEYSSIREDPEELTKRLVNGIYKIMNEHKLFFGILDVEVDAFMNEQFLTQWGVELDYKTVSRLMESHKHGRDLNLFPDLIVSSIDKENRIKIEFQGKAKNLFQLIGTKIEDLADKIRNAKGFGIGLVATSKGAANFYILTENIVMREGEYKDIQIDQDNIDSVFYGIQRQWIVPLCWFRIDMGISAIETLELWEEIKEKKEVIKAVKRYDDYINALIYKKYKIMSQSQISKDTKKDFGDMTTEEKEKALKDMKKAMDFLNEQLDNSHE
jgi:hypothetical protein